MLDILTLKSVERSEPMLEGLLLLCVHVFALYSHYVCVYAFRFEFKFIVHGHIHTQL